GPSAGTPNGATRHSLPMVRLRILVKGSSEIAASLMSERPETDGERGYPAAPREVVCRGPAPRNDGVCYAFGFGSKAHMRLPRRLCLGTHRRHGCNQTLFLRPLVPPQGSAPRNDG